MTSVSVLVGKTITGIVYDGDCDIDITTSDGERYRFTHHQDCCESVGLIEGENELDSLIGQPILLAEERSSDNEAYGARDQWDESYTWTYYCLATINGHVDLRWYGTSNGYYSESVDFEWLNKDKKRWNNGFGVWE